MSALFAAWAETRLLVQQRAYLRGKRVGDVDFRIVLELLGLEGVRQHAAELFFDRRAQTEQG